MGTPIGKVTAEVVPKRNDHEWDPNSVQTTPDKVMQENNRVTGTFQYNPPQHLRKVFTHLWHYVNLGWQNTM